MGNNLRHEAGQSSGRGDTKNVQVQVDFPGQPENRSRLAVVAWLRENHISTVIPRVLGSLRPCVSSPPAKFIVSDGELACFGIPSIFYITYNIVKFACMSRT